MQLTPSFSASARVWENKSWVYALEEIGYAGWEVVADGTYSLENPENRTEIEEILASTKLLPTVHAPYSDLNLASINYPIWRESVRQVCSCVGHAAALGAKRVTFHPGYVSPVGKLVPEKVWAAQKEALAEIGQAAVESGTLACLENMVGVREFLCLYPE
jgi:sugar phosphate isomerase/epimerase